MKTSELTGAALDWAVAKCEGILDRGSGPLNTAIAKLTRNGIVLNFSADDSHFEPSTDWAQGGPIIEREKISSMCNKNRNFWLAGEWEPRFLTDTWSGNTLLVATMRCYVASKLGNDVEIPEELS